MGRTICVIVIVVFKAVFVSTGDYPAFMDEDDIRVRFTNVFLKYLSRTIQNKFVVNVFLFLSP